MSLALLFLSTYLYAVDYIRYGFKALDSFKIFKYIQIAGDTLYLIAVVSPIIYLCTWLVVKVALLIPSTTTAFKVSSQLTSTLVSVVSLFFTVYASWIQNKEMKKVKEQLLDDSSLTAENEAKALIEKNQWNLAIMEAFRSVELAINKNLVDIGIEPSRMPIARSLDLLIKQGIITKDDYNKIQYIRELRNKAAHSMIEHSKDEALEVMNIVKEIVPKIGIAGSSYSNFEKKALSALIGENGLFVKHHFFGEHGVIQSGFDARAEGPNFEYLIEVKKSKNPATVIVAFENLKKSLHDKRRGLIVVPNDMMKINLPGDRVKLLFYNNETGHFENKEEIYKWIYG